MRRRRFLRRGGTGGPRNVFLLASANLIGGFGPPVSKGLSQEQPKEPIALPARPLFLLGPPRPSSTLLDPPRPLHSISQSRTNLPSPILVRHRKFGRPARNAAPILSVLTLEWRRTEIGIPPNRLQSRRISDLRIAKLPPKATKYGSGILQANWHILTRGSRPTAARRGTLHDGMGDYQSCRCFQSSRWLNGNFSNFPF
jgi:hypothetical protein